MFYSFFKALFLVSLFLSWITLASCGKGFVTTQIGPKPLWNDTWVDKLKKHLFLNYNRLARPENHDVATNVKIGLTIVHLETDEAHSTLILHSWLALKWTDSKLKWNPDEYGDLKTIRVADHEVWIPDIYLYDNAIGSSRTPSLGNHNVILYPHGEVMWVPTVTYLVLCNFDLQYWPYDTHHCTMLFGSWVHSETELTLELLHNDTTSVKLESFAEAKYDVVLTSEVGAKKYNCCIERYPYSRFNFTLTRKSAPYKPLVITPALVTTYLILLQFWLPANAQEKIVLNCLTAAIINIFLIYFNSQLMASGSTPLIVSFYSSSLIVVGISTITRTINYCLCKIRNYHPFIWLTNFLLRNDISWWLYLEDYSKRIIQYREKENERELKDPNEIVDFDSVSIKILKNSEKLIQLEWLLVSVFLDRIFFIMYTIIFLVLAITFL